MEATVSLDHPYTKHWSESYKTDTRHAKPIQWLLPACRRNAHWKHIASRQRFLATHNINLSSDGSEDEIDVESLDEVMSPYTPGRTYDVQRARLNMNETERLTTQSLGKQNNLEGRSEEDWDLSIPKLSWSATQAKLFSKVLKVLEDEKLARLAYKGMSNEPVARRLALDHGTSCLRRIFAEFSWDQKLTQWLHSLLLNKLPPGLLSCFLDLIQTLRSRVPALVERMIMQSSSESSIMGSSTLNILLKKPWEPSLVKYPLVPKQRLYEAPIILIIPNSPFAPSPTMAHRRRFWNSHLSQLGKVINLSSPDKAPGMTVLSYVEQLAAAVRSKIEVMRNKYPTRPIVLLGWHTASVLACHISLVEKVSAVICLGFPTRTMNGHRGSVDDILCDMTTSTLFIVGEEADSCDINTMEDFREQLLTRCETYLLAVPGADDSLRVNERLKKRALVTQHMVDRMALDYVSKFFSESLITSVRNWNVDEITGYKGNSMSYKHKRRRESSEDFDISLAKRRRLSSATSARISEVLASHSSRRGRDGSRIPVLGVSYNLQTGALNGMATVPNVLRRSPSLVTDQITSSKSRGRGKSQTRSITIDLAKDAASQLKRRKSYGRSPDPILLPTGSQTEAAVATILANDFPSDETLPMPVSLPKKTEFEKKEAKLSPISEATAKSSNDGPAFMATASTTFTSQSQSSTFENASSRRLAYSNVKFNSTVISKSTSEASTQPVFSTINKQDWAGIFDSVPQTSSLSDISRKYPSPIPPESSTHLTSRSRKEEKETLQATAILEKLTSGIDNDTEQAEATRVATAYRRRTVDTGNFISAARGRGRVRTRGGSMIAALSRDAAIKRRKSAAVESTTPLYLQKMQPAQLQKTPQSVVGVKRGGITRYVVSSGVGTMFTNTTKIVSTTVGSTATPVNTARTVTQALKTQPKPTILPVYSFTPASPAATASATGAGVTNQPRFPSTSTSKGAFTVVQSRVVQQQVVTKKPTKLMVGQRLPVKFPGAVPGSSYTFVTIPALTGPPLPATGQRNVAVHASKIKKEPVKYSVVARHPAQLKSAISLANVTQSPNIVAVVRPKTVPLKGNVLKPVQVVATAGTASASPSNPVPANPTPAIASSSVILHKLWKETVSEMGADAATTPTENKQDPTT